MLVKSVLDCSFKEPLLPLTRNAVGCNISSNRINVDNFSECATLSHDDGTPYDELCMRLVMLVNKPENHTTYPD